MPKTSSSAKRLPQDAGSDWRRSLAVARLRRAENVVHEAFLYKTYAERQLLLRDLANLQGEDAVNRFWKRHNVLPEPRADLVEMCNELRKLWLNPPALQAEQLLNKWLYWLPSQVHLEMYKHPMKPGPASPKDFPEVFLKPFECSITARKLVPLELSLRGMLIQGVFENWQHLKICSNPECPARYFIAKRSDQTICEAGPCKAEKQRRHALKWWRENRSVTARKRNGQKFSGLKTKGAKSGGTRKTR